MIFTEDSGQNLSDVLRELRERQDRELPFQMGSAAVNKVSIFSFLPKIL